MLRFEAFVSRDPNQWLHTRRGLPICAHTRMPSSQPKRNYRSLLIISYMDSQISLRASTYNARERSAHRNGLKLCESSKQAKHHGCQIPPLLPPLPALHTPHVVPLRHSLRTTNRTLLTRVLVIEKTSRNRARVTHEVNNPQTRIY